MKSSSLKQQTLLFCCIFLISIVLFAVIYDHYFAFKAYMSFSKVTVHLEDDFNYDMPVLAFSEVNPTKTYIDNISAYTEWRHEIDNAFYTRQYITPTNIKLTCELDGSNVTFIFKGTTTSPEGKTIHYYNERTFDFVIVPDINDLIE